MLTNNTREAGAIAVQYLEGQEAEAIRALKERADLEFGEGKYKLKRIKAYDYRERRVIFRIDAYET